MIFKRKIFGLRPPLAIFIISMLILSLSGYLIIHLTLMKNLSEDGKFITVKTETFRFNFPRNWYAYPLYENETLCLIYLVNAESDSVAIILYYKSWKQIFSLIKGNNLTDNLSIAISEVNRFFIILRERSQNATLHFIENGTILISGYNASYTIFNIQRAFTTNEGTYNITGVFISLLMANNGLFKIVFYTWKDEFWEDRYKTFKLEMLDSLVIKYGVK
jgi:hypothetical protein